MGRSSTSGQVVDSHLGAANSSWHDNTHGLFSICSTFVLRYGQAVDMSLYRIAPSCFGVSSHETVAHCDRRTGPCPTTSLHRLPGLRSMAA